MIIRNLSTRTITLKDNGGVLYTVPALGDLIIDDAKWTEAEFRRWMRYRSRDIVIVAASTSLHAGTHATGTTDPLTGLLDAKARVAVRKNTGGADVGARRRLNPAPPSTGQRRHARPGT